MVMSKSPTYTTWRGMKNRSRKKVGPYAHVGIDPSWLDFAMFIKDMGERPEGKEIDRVDPTLGYTKDNCRWVDSIQQNRNRRSAVMLSYAGRTLCISEWAEVLGINEWTLRARYCKYGWSAERTLSTPVSVRR